jgi:hypothetical protein
MNFTIPKLIDSIAGQLTTLYPNTPVYDSPSYNTDYPCFYVFVTVPSIADQIDGVEMRDIGFDIVYVQQRNSPAQNAELMSVLETLDESFDMLTYVDGNLSAPLHTHDRNASIEDQELHYKLTIRQRVSREEIHNYMAEMEEQNVEIKEQ